MTETDTTTHTPEPWFWEADSDHCPHGPEPEDDTSDEWDTWQDCHQWAPQDVRICRDAPAGDACGECSAEHGEMVPWADCAARPRRQATPEPPAVHQPVTVDVAGLECAERECEEFFTDDGDEIPGKDTCSHYWRMEICEACTGAGDFPPVVAWADCPQKPAPA